MNSKHTKNNFSYTAIRVFIAFVWIMNGAYCKLLGMVPRHQDIIGEILSLDRPSAYLITKVIGILEILMAIWILTRIAPKLNAILQIVIIATMNIIEIILVPDLLLWGGFNLVFATIFMVLIYFNEFHLNKKITSNPDAVIP